MSSAPLPADTGGPALDAAAQPKEWIVDKSAATSVPKLLCKCTFILLTPSNTPSRRGFKGRLVELKRFFSIYSQLNSTICQVRLAPSFRLCLDVAFALLATALPLLAITLKGSETPFSLRLLNALSATILASYALYELARRTPKNSYAAPSTRIKLISICGIFWLLFFWFVFVHFHSFQIALTKTPAYKLEPWSFYTGTFVLFPVAVYLFFRKIDAQQEIQSWYSFRFFRRMKDLGGFAMYFFALAVLNFSSALTTFVLPSASPGTSTSSSNHVLYIYVIFAISTSLAWSLFAYRSPRLRCLGLERALAKRADLLAALTGGDVVRKSSRVAADHPSRDKHTEECYKHDATAAAPRLCFLSRSSLRNRGVQRQRPLRVQIAKIAFCEAIILQSKGGRILRQNFNALLLPLAPVSVPACVLILTPLALGSITATPAFALSMAGVGWGLYSLGYLSAATNQIEETLATDASNTHREQPQDVRDRYPELHINILAARDELARAGWATNAFAAITVLVPLYLQYVSAFRF